MKNNIITVLAACAVLCLTACEREIDKTCLGASGTYVAPVLKGVTDLVVDKTNGDETMTFNWADASFGAATQILYSVYLGYGGNTVLIGNSYTDSYTISKNDLNSYVTTDLGGMKNEVVPLTAYVEASLESGIEARAKSNTIAFNITTFDAPKDCIYLPGIYNKWTSTATDVWEMEGGTKVYRILADFTGVGDYAPGAAYYLADYCQFKLYIGDSWLGYNDGYNADWGIIYENGDGNFAVPENEPINFITVNVGKKTLYREMVSAISAIGSFAESNGWANDVDFTYDHDNNVWVTPELTFADGGEFLIRTNYSWGESDKYGDALVKSTEVDGGYELTNSGSAANIKIDNLGGAGTYVLKVYGNHTPLVLVAEKK